MRLMTSLALACLALPACATHFSRGTHAYDDGCYPEAMQELIAAERHADGWSGADRTKYALYRGLAHLALGDREQAERWLGEAKARWDADRFVLGDGDRGRLLSAWQAMGHAPGEWGADVLHQRGL